MSGGSRSSVSGYSSQSGGGSGSSTSIQTPIFPPELKNVETQMASGLSNVLTSAPIAGKYSKTMLNPEFQTWQNQYGKYNAQPGYYYSNLANPDQIVYKLNKGDTGVQGYFDSQEIGPGGVPVGAEIPSGQVSQQLLYIPPIPQQYIPDPSSLQPGTSFLEPHPQEIAPLAALEQQAMTMYPALGQAPATEQKAVGFGQKAADVVQNRATNQPYYEPGAFEASPYFQTAKGAFEQGVAPTIMNQMALAGLGRSTSLGDSLAKGWAQMAPTALSQYATQYVEPELARAENQISREASTLTSLVPLFSAMGIQDTQRMLTTLQEMMRGGGLERSIQQAAKDAEQADFLRKQALAEEALYTPMGMLFPSAIGQKTQTTGTYSNYGSGTTNQSAVQSGGGLFK